MDTDDETSGVRGATISSGKAEHGKFSQESKKAKEAEDIRAQREAEARAKEEERQRDPVPGWATRLIPGCIIECSTEAENTDAVDSAARIIDIIIFTHIKRRYRPFYGSMVKMDVKHYMKRVQDYGSIPEFDNYFPLLGTDANGELICRRTRTWQLS